MNAIIGDNGIITKALNASFLSEMTAVQEAYELWQTSHYDDNEMPTNGIVQSKDISENGRLYGEIAYYRRWSETGTMPDTSIKLDTESFNKIFDGDISYIPRGVEDLYYLDNKKLGLEENKKYIVDLTTGIIYAMSKYTVENVDVHSLPMYKAVVNGETTAPKFAQAEVSGGGDNLAYAGQEYLKDKQGNYVDENGNIVSEENKVINPNGFKIIADPEIDNVYKLYNNGDLYGKGVKGIGLQTSDSQMEALNNRVFHEWHLPSGVPDSKKIILGESGALFIIDNAGDCFAIGTNTDNKFGLTDEQQNEYNGRSAIKLNVNGEKVYNVFDTGNSVFIVTESNKLYAAGYNLKGNLGLGNDSVVNSFSLVHIDEKLNLKKIWKLCGDWSDGTMIWYNDSNLPERSYEWAQNNRFFWTGKARWGFGGINGGKAPTNCSFVEIWDGNNGPNINKDILYCTLNASPWILTIDGTVKQSGYGGSGIGSGWVGGGSDVNFRVRPEAMNKKFKKMWFGGATFILLDENDKLWGVSSNSSGVLGLSERTWNLVELNNLPFDVTELKEVQITLDNVFYLLKNGKVYASGKSFYSGLGELNQDVLTGITLLSSGEDNAFPEVDTLYGGHCIFGELIKNGDDQSRQGDNNLFLGSNGKLYLTGNSSLMFGDDILEKNWVLVANNVKYFEPKCPAYIDKNGDLFVAGENSDYLGLGENNNRKVKKFTKVDNDLIANKAVKFQFASTNSYVLTSDNKLYGTGLYQINGTACYAGWSEAVDKKEYVEILTDIVDFSSRGNVRIAITNTNKAYGWGVNWGGELGFGGEFPLTPKEFNFDSKTVSSGNDVASLIVTGGTRSFLLTKVGKFFITGMHDNGTWNGGFTGISNKFVEYTYNLPNGEKIVDFDVIDSSTVILLTDTGKLYGYGPSKVMGIGKSDGTNINMQYLGIDDVISITAGKGYFIAVKKDGSVWGTGNNVYGTLGRWAGSDRKKTNSRYRTAFEWVECPDLEL